MDFQRGIKVRRENAFDPNTVEHLCWQVDPHSMVMMVLVTHANVFYCHRYIGIGIGLGMGGGGSRLVATTRARGMGYLGEETQPTTWCLLTPPPKKE